MDRTSRQAKPIVNHLNMTGQLIDLVVEHYRNLWNFVKVIHEKEDDGTSICNTRTCPKMSAGT